MFAIFLIIFSPAFLFAQSFDPKQALAYEIASASKKELIEMASSLGLSISGSEDDLRSRLYSHYAISPPEKAQIELKKAQKIYSGPIASLNQSVTRLTGGVEIQVTEGSAQHTIRAENIIIYQKTQAIYASGNVQYELDQEGGKQVFFAKNMMFNSKKWASLLVDISGQNTFALQEGEQETEFYLKGKKIEKKSSGLVLLDGVVVTSCDDEDPHYHFRFSRLWVLNEKEAVAQNLTMYLGHVPVFYLPFYYHGQDILPFNPVIGFRSRDGIYINTTTYLYGKKTSSSASGLFNIMGDKTQDSDDDEQGGYLKLMVDYYSMLGVFGGFGGYIPVMNTQFQLGVAYSRTIFDSVSIYPVTGPVQEQINTSTWFGITLPFRYGVDIQGEAENFTYRVQNYSDPYFDQDFFFRQENAGFFGFLASFGGTTQQQEIYQTESYLRYKNSWNFNYPGLSTLAIDYINFEMISTVKPNANINTSDSPNYYFYIPSTFNLPNIQMRLEGDWSLNPEKKSDENKEDEEEQIPAISADIPAVLEENNLNLLTVATQERDYKSAIFYRWQMNERLYYQPYTTPWNRPEDRRIIFDDMRSLTVSRLNLGVETTTNDNYFTFREGFQLDLQYLSRFNEAAAINPTQEVKNDQSNRFFILSNVFDLGYYPLIDVQNWEKTGFEYHMTARIYQNVYNANTDTRINTPTFLPDKHYVNGQIRYDTGFWWAYFSTKTELPPNILLKSETQSGVGFEYWGFSAEAYTYVHENISTFNSKGYGATAQYKPLDDIAIYQTTEVDFFTGLNMIDVGVKLYGFSAVLRWEDRYLWDFNRNLYTWQTVLLPNGSQAHSFVLSYLDLRLNEDVTLFEFWDKRGRVKLLLNSQWLIDFMRYDQSSLRFGFGFGFEITDMISISLSTNSLNRATYLYFPFMRNKMGITGSYNFFSDLWDSFKFWDISARQKSNFKLENIQASVSLDLHDWMLSVIYTGGPKTGAFTVKNLWDNQVSFLIAWKAVPAIKTQANYDPQYGLYLGQQRASR